MIGTSMSQGLLTILSAENHNQASSMLANTLIDLISQNNGEATIGLAGGSTPSMTYSILCLLYTSDAADE